MKYLLISPVRDEENYLESTVKSVLAQSTKPSLWILVDDGSIDSTPMIIRKYASEHSWIKQIRLERNRSRQPGGAIIEAFNEGFRLVSDTPFDIIVKMDCDLRFDPQYFEGLLREFQEDPYLGIASGVYLENRRGRWMPVAMPDYHAAGACKALRRECFEDIGGFVVARGWDTVDEIRARARGWRTRHFRDLIMYHLKKEGSGIGPVRTAAMQGEVFYLTGGSTRFFLLKLIHRILFGSPPIVAGLAMLSGYLRVRVSGRPLLVDANEASLYRTLLHSRVRRFLEKLDVSKVT